MSLCAAFRLGLALDGTALYLGLVAPLPYSTHVLGLYGDQPTAVVLYAATVAVVSRGSYRTLYRPVARRPRVTGPHHYLGG